ncbi:ring finger domain-containing protein [Ditylenchus destructor]|uniref:Ring finger domain-containing protein n=1 Tax=Ditylenchus destructor TaxID=166010 RepID=A0AAD4MI47_9BILA|nr:ring finger domain-containing protein [Ditylenchus destructor]
MAYCVLAIAPVVGATRVVFDTLSKISKLDLNSSSKTVGAENFGAYFQHKFFQECSICLGELTEEEHMTQYKNKKEQVTQLQCGHFFHRNCAKSWLVKKQIVQYAVRT